VHTKIKVTHESTDEEIFVAIRKAGEKRLSWRRNDWPEPSENYQFAWVKPGDIGISTSEDTRLYKRLCKLLKEGKLERRFGSCAVVHYTVQLPGVALINGGGFGQKTKVTDNWPRFRVVEN
jgi:hypothetical protein